MFTQKQIEAAAEAIWNTMRSGTDYEEVLFISIMQRPRYSFLKERVFIAAKATLEAAEAAAWQPIKTAPKPSVGQFVGTVYAEVDFEQNQ